MRAPAFLALTLLGWLVLVGLGHAQMSTVTTFDGQGTQTTAFFNVADKWELQWLCPDLVAVTVFAPDGSVVAGTSGTGNGALFLGKGGKYYLEVSRVASSKQPWHVGILQLDGGAKVADALVAPVPAPNPTSPPAVAATTSNAASNSVAATTNAAPIAPAAPDASPSTNAPVAAPPDALTGDQARAIVLVKGDVAEGTGFLVRTPDGPAVITNQHVIFANPNIHILTSAGEEVKTLSLKGASDRDLAMFMIQDNHYSYLEMSADLSSSVQTGDTVITPGNSEGGEVMLNTKGKILGIGPERIEIDNPIYHGNSGGPIFHVATGRVVGVVTEAGKVVTTDEVDKASFANKNSAITGDMRYFGLRLDTVPKWEAYDWNQFLLETTFLKNFHEQSRCLDSLLNGAAYEKAKEASSGEEGRPDSRYYLRDDKITAAYESFHKMQVDADQSQRLDAIREVVIDLDGIADARMDAIQSAGNFYSFDQQRAQAEVKYRKWLRDEIDKIGDRVGDMGH